MRPNLATIKIKVVKKGKKYDLQKQSQPNKKMSVEQPIIGDEKIMLPNPCLRR